MTQGSEAQFDRAPGYLLGQRRHKNLTIVAKWQVFCRKMKSIGQHRSIYVLISAVIVAGRPHTT